LFVEFILMELSLISVGAELDAGQLRAFLEDRLSTFEIPNALFCVSSIPKNAIRKAFRSFFIFSSSLSAVRPQPRDGDWSVTLSSPHGEPNSRLRKPHEARSPLGPCEFFGKRAFASEVALTGRYFSAEEALAAGTLSRVAPSGAHRQVARELAEQIAMNPPLSVRAADRTRRWFMDRFEREVAA
jgi:hypothetical protein